MLAFSSLMIILLVFIGIFSGLTPYFNQSAQFGVTLPKKYQTSEFVKGQRKRFFGVNTLVSLILILPIFYLMTLPENQETAKWLALYLIVAMLIFFILSGGIFLIIRKKMLMFKKELPATELAEEEQNIVIDTKYRQGRLVLPSSLILMTNLLIIAFIIGITFLNYNQIPDRIVTHWDINMQPDKFTEKSLFSVLFLPAMQLFMMVVLYTANYSYQHAKQKVNPNNPAVSVEKNQAFRYAWSVFTLIMSIVLQLFLGFMQLATIFNWMNQFNFPIVMLIFIVLLYVAIGYLSFKYGQGGERLKGHGNQKFADELTGYDEDQSWKLGVFYFNPADPSVWVEKRFGIGITMNMARWQTWCFFIGILAVPIILAFFLS